MAAPTLIKMSSGTFKGKAISGAQSAQIEFGGSEQEARGDGAIAVQLSYVEGIRARITVVALAAQITDTDHILPGNGALVIVGFTQAAGRGAVAGQNKTWTFSNATLLNTSRGIPIDGNPTVNLNFEGVAVSGDPADIASIG